ncbi:MAG: dTDP-4-dehydrorhamnose reductase [Acidobacteriota bacterium]
MVTIERPRILILGSAGQLGRELLRSFADMGPVTALDRAHCDLSQPDSIRAQVRAAAPHVILNAGAYTAVDRAESERERAYAINATAPGILAEEARTRGALLVHYSTDYVFDGSKHEPWTEEDAPNPLSAYGASKLAGEQAVLAVGGRFLIFRTSWVYGPHGRNFLFTMLRLGREREKLSIVDDQFGAPTTSLELAAATRAIVADILAGRSGGEADWTGLYHMTCAGSTSWFGFAQAIFQRAAAQLARAPELTPISSESYPTPARRPRNSVLSNEKLAARFGVQLAPWTEALDRVFAEIPSAPDEARGH